jgi:hypothetical protein
MPWHGMAWHGMAWHGMEWNGMTARFSKPEFDSSVTGVDISESSQLNVMQSSRAAQHNSAPLCWKLHYMRSNVQIGN